MHWITLTGGAPISVFRLTREPARRGYHIELSSESGGEVESEYRTSCRSDNRAHLRVRRPGLAGNLTRAAAAIWAGARRRPAAVLVRRFDVVPFGALTGRLARAPVERLFTRQRTADGVERVLRKVTFALSSP
jgi:hypothetical protein